MRQNVYFREIGNFKTLCKNTNYFVCGKEFFWLVKKTIEPFEKAQPPEKQLSH
jgi:hypothetical protein